jgi:demethylmenaquinone methyltransferase / 2-methoxy-6-polyprenyl-1,4-benzoquinol methylase
MTVPGTGAARDALPAGQEKAVVVRGMFDRIAGRYDLLNRLLTLGMDVGWRRQAVRALGLAPGSRVLDVACGTGDLCRAIEAAGMRAIGVDFSFGMLGAAGGTTAWLTQADALTLPIPSGAVEGVTCGFALRNVVDIRRAFDEMARVTRAGGRVAILEVAEPANPVLRAGHSIYFRHVVPVVGSILSDGAAYRYLPRSVSYLPPPTELMEMLRSAGFAEPRRRPLSGGIAQLIVGTRR